MTSHGGNGIASARPDRPKLCPSAQPDMADAVVLGVVGGSIDAPRLSYLAERIEASAELLAETGDVSPTRVFRFAATCEEKACRHFDGSRCQLAARIVNLLDPVVPALPPCRIRQSCRWHAEEGAAACLRCPQVVTETAMPSERYRAAALGPEAGGA